MLAGQTRGVEHGTDRVKESVEHSFSYAILMRGVADRLFLDDAMFMAILGHFIVDEFRSAIGPKDFDGTAKLGAKLIGILNEVVIGFILGF